MRTFVSLLQKMAMPVVVISAATALGAIFFYRGQGIMEDQLRERLRSNAAIAAFAIDPALVEAVRGAESIGTPPYEALIHKLDALRDQMHNVRFMYIMRQTQDPMMLEFVADADAAVPEAELDKNADGSIQDDELPALPGEEYDVSEVFALQEEAFKQATVDKEITEDRWGKLVSGYAPIVDSEGVVVGTVGIDMEAEEFIRVAHSIFSPVGVLLVILAGVLCAAYAQFVIHRRKMEAMEELNAERNALLDLTMHQLGAPIAMLRWWLEILSEDQSKKPDKDALNQLKEGVDRVKSIFDSLTEVTQLSEDATDYKPTYVPLRVVSEEVLVSLKENLSRKKQHVEVQIPPDLKPVKIDKRLLTGVIHELIMNASNYSPEATTIVLRATMHKRNAQIQIIDTGYGIPPADIGKLFEKFHRGSNAAKYRPVGNGLGLYIAKRIIEKAKGKIRLESTLGKGTTITITLPLL